MTGNSLKAQPSKPSISNQAACTNEQATVRTSQASASLSIATSVVTQVSESLNEASFLQPATSCHAEISMVTESQSNKDLALSSSTSSQTMDNNSVEFNLPKHDEAHSFEPAGMKDMFNAQVSYGQAQTINQIKSEIEEEGKLAVIMHQKASKTAPTTATTVTLTKKKAKTNKKSIKLDTKSKLEKSRQSARECRARKKLRYQYLEDLVCNREKAVVKLREELSLFCKMSEQIDTGTISDTDRHFLVEQTKENSKG